MSIWKIANPNLQKLKPYEPGKPVEDVARELGMNPKTIIKLASNENPLGPSPKALRAMRDALRSGHLYPDGGGFHLRNALAERHGLERNQVVIGNGSNEIIELILHAFASSGSGNVIASQHAFIVYKLIAQLFGAEFIEVPARQFEHDLDAIAAAINSNTKAVFITNSNNPTGTRVPNDRLKKFIFNVPERVIIALDEAYYEFLDDAPPTISWMKERPNLILIRTFSKIHGLAGLRIGYGLMQLETAEILQRCRQPFNTNSIAQAGALAALTDEAHQKKTLKLTFSGKKKLERFCRKLGLEYIPSHANFVMIRVGQGEEVFQQLMREGIIVRPLRGGYHLPEWIRVTIGTRPQMKRFYETFPAVLKNLGITAS
ncbi:MAG: histidinol-phosphate transaminase [bacterium]